MLPKKSIKQIQHVQNASARLILSGKKYNHITFALLMLHWLPVEYRILFKIILLTFKSLNGQWPSYLKDLLVPYNPAHSLRSSSGYFLLCPYDLLCRDCQEIILSQSPNEMEQSKVLRDCSSVNLFKSELKTYFYKMDYGFS
jgi:hypothetical protein